MAPKKCIFCEICAKRQPADFVYEDEEVVIFKDIKPAAKHHYLCVPVRHIQDVNQLTKNDKPLGISTSYKIIKFRIVFLVEKLISIGKMVLERNGCDLDNIRLGFHMPPFNSVSHLHLHVIAPASELSFIGRSIFMPNTWWFGTVSFNSVY